MYLKTNRRPRLLIYWIDPFIRRLHHRSNGKIMAWQMMWISSRQTAMPRVSPLIRAKDFTRVTIYNVVALFAKSRPYETYYLYKNDSVLSLLPGDGWH